LREPELNLFLLTLNTNADAKEQPVSRAYSIRLQAHISFGHRPAGNSRFRERSFFGTLLAGRAAVADFGAYRGKFFAASTM
jgi:hypothetical protein